MNQLLLKMLLVVTVIAMSSKNNFCLPSFYVGKFRRNFLFQWHGAGPYATNEVLNIFNAHSPNGVLSNRFSAHVDTASAL
jgi:hypothetical protein